jgi:hypothetical protein
LPVMACCANTALGIVQAINRMSKIFNFIRIWV